MQKYKLIMYDYMKLWIDEDEEIKKIVSSSLLSFAGLYNRNTGEIIEYPQIAKWNVFELKLKSPTRLEITGSLHKYWNNGTNENDFTFNDARKAIDNLCKDLSINPSCATIHNLEYGVNICPSIDASELIENIICFKNVRPLRPYEGNDEKFFFIEFKKGNNYLKIYDKGRQYKTKNTLRIEIKAMRSKELKDAGAITLKDLKNKKVFQVLGRKLMQFSNNIVFNDTSIRPENLDRKERELYKEFVNPNRWIIKGVKTTTQYRKEQKFIGIVSEYGDHKFYSRIQNLVESKIVELQYRGCNNLLSKYNDKPLQFRGCLSCGKDISHQDRRSKFCSSKFVGEAAAHQCRNRNSNPRNNLKNKLRRLEGRGILFDIRPYLIEKGEIKQFYGL